MSRPEAQYGPGDTIKLELAHPFDPITVAPIRGEHELWIAARRIPGMSPAELETLVLRAGMVESRADPAQWLIGDRNRALLAILSAGFGAPKELWVSCSECDEMHEVPFDPAQMICYPPSDAMAFQLAKQDGMIEARLPSGADLEAADGDAAALLSTCAPELTQSQFETEIATRDPCAELRFPMGCVACGKTFIGAVDPIALLFAELDRHGGVLAEVGQLAQVYHWSEGDLAALPSWRRRLYFRQQMTERMAS